MVYLDNLFSSEIFIILSACYLLEILFSQKNIIEKWQNSTCILYLIVIAVHTVYFGFRMYSYKLESVLNFLVLIKNLKKSYLYT